MNDPRENASQREDDPPLLQAADELPAFGYSWPCSACGATVKGYAVLCACGEC
jgi:hypothetical protein